jgi:hypothetical protein
VYLRALVTELRDAGELPAEGDVSSFEELLTPPGRRAPVQTGATEEEIAARG